MTGDGAWRPFRRVGSVTAQRLERDVSWTTDCGDTLVGHAGDWQVSDGNRVWTVADAEFRRSYEPSGGAFRRRGTVRARPGLPGEVVRTLEGVANVGPGDWLVEGEGGERWPVPAARFSTAYVAVPPDAG